MIVIERISKIFFLFFIVVLPLGQLARVPLCFLPTEVKIYLTDIFLGISIFFWLLRKWFFSQKKTRPVLTVPILSFFCVGVVSLLVNNLSFTFKEITIASLYLWRWLLYAGIYFLVTDFEKNNNLFSLKSRFLIIVGIGVVVAILGLIQYLVWPDFRGLEIDNWDPHYYRVVGTYLDPGFTGLIYVFTLALIVVMYFHKDYRSEKWRKRLLAIGIPIYLAFAFTYSRSSYLAYLVAAGVIAIFRKSARIFTFALILLLFTMIILPRPGGEGVRLERWASIAARIRSWRQSIVIFRDHPVLGIGFNTYRYVQREYGFLTDDWVQNHAGAGADSSLLLVLATTGIVGLGFYLWLCYQIIKQVMRKTEKNPLALGILACLTALWVHSLFLNSQFYSWIMALVWLLLGGLEAVKKARR